MDLKEVDNLSLEEEKRHWWITTRFNYIDSSLRFLENEQITALEFGCGTAQNLWYLRQKSLYKKKIESVTGVDINLPDNFRPEWSLEQDNFKRELKGGKQKYDLILAMDVLEHIDEELDALHSWISYLSQKGVVLITVPAFHALWSYHDQYLGHKRRYTKKSLQKIAEQAGLVPLKLTYAFGPLFPIVYLVRKLFASKKESSDLKLPPPWINAPLQAVGNIEAFLGGTPFFGTSVVGIFKKEGPYVYSR